MPGGPLSDSPTHVADGAVVLMHYTLTNDAGAELDSTRGRDPMPYLHGASNIVPGLERALAGMAVGDHRDVVVAPEDAYGPRRGGPAAAVPRSAFPADAQIVEGMTFAAEDGDGERVQVWVSRIDGDQVFVDLNHPLAGQTLHFSVDIAGLRAPTPSELEHGHPHGLDGHAGH